VVGTVSIVHVVVENKSRKKREIPAHLRTILEGLQQP
jgi:acyl-CoA thioesterase FadM